MNWYKLKTRAEIWWLLKRIRSRNSLIEDLQSYRINTRELHSEINLYLFELRDRNSIDASRIVSLTYLLGEKFHG